MYYDPNYYYGYRQISYLAASELIPFTGKWGIFTMVNGQRIVAYVDSVDTVNESVKVLFSDGRPATIDTRHIVMAMGPFPSKPKSKKTPKKKKWTPTPRGWVYL